MRKKMKKNESEKRDGMKDKNRENVTKDQTGLVGKKSAIQ